MPAQDDVSRFVALPQSEQRRIFNALPNDEKFQVMREIERRTTPATAEPAPDAAIAVPTPSEVGKGGIKAIHWKSDFEVESIETEDGQTLYPTPAPNEWDYFLIALFPIPGFFIPWGAVRAIGWVGAGFFQPSK